MSRADAKTSDDLIESRERTPDQDDNRRGAATASWDPYQVWLTRIKQPREHAAHLAAASTPRRAIGNPE